MASYGSTTFTDPADCRVNVPGAAIDLEFTNKEAFRARATWVKFRHLTLAAIEQAAAGTAVVSWVAPGLFLSFPLRGEPLWNGRRLRPGDFLLQGRGERLHQVSETSTRWGVIAITRQDLTAYSRTLLGVALQRACIGPVLRPRGKSAGALLRLHAQACRLAATKPDIMAHREVARALEQDLIVALVSAIAAGQARSAARRRTVAESA